jgi:hypothetical protein
MRSALQVLLTVAPVNGKPQRIVEARVGELVYRDNLDTNSARSRQRFIEALAAKLKIEPAELAELDVDLVRHADAADEQVEHAAASVEKAIPCPSSFHALPEIEPSRIVRPERFITLFASGLAVPVRNEIDGRIVGRTVIYIRHADGRREMRPLGVSLDLVEAGRLFVHPLPSEPSASALAGWSPEARQEWLNGSAAAEPTELFERICRRLAEFIDLPNEHAAGTTATLALWVMLTYVYQAWPAVPYLYIGGPLGSGKSRLFEVLARLVFRPLASSNLTAAALFRTLNDRGGTLLLDEAERLRQGNDPQTAELLSMLLAGYKRGGQATRLEAVGDSFRTVNFDVFGLKALACVAGLPAALASRCITIMMFRAPPGSDKPKRRIDADAGAWQSNRNDLHSFALEHGPTWLELAERTDVCRGMSGRDFELWQPIMAIAEWIESKGASGLRGLVESHALATIDTGRDELAPEVDSMLLRTLAELLRSGARPRASDILAKVQQAEPEAFKRWSCRTVAVHCKRYGVETRKAGGERVYPADVLAALEKVQANYGMELGFGE